MARTGLHFKLTSPRRLQIRMSVDGESVATSEFGPDSLDTLIATLQNYRDQMEGNHTDSGVTLPILRPAHSREDKKEK
ncbi:hypothetical protein GCM10007989_04510 [Devosia pacifica]|uniref:Uncharacterized protein n=1 Tax=Devosia pacifica TaxID=1335967 RepID=A0A918RUW9_9HYPH|nr:hypothetical protein [Devosia pacifica]GHA13047.1 hypothetical protein GCM10007989_04510 [Devosia pacifica]